MKSLFKYIFYKILPYKISISYVYKKATGKKMNWSDPKDLNEKINWLKLYSDTSQWPILADKYRMREYVRTKGLENILVPLLGKWDKVEDIDFEKLPNQFVIKTNHGSGDYIIVEDKLNININDIKKKIKHSLSTPYGLFQGEPHYLYIKPCVIAEPLLKQNSTISSSLIDYKVFCFNGEPNCIFCFHNRDDNHYEFELHDLNWDNHPEKLVFNDHSRDGKGKIPKPNLLDDLLSYARCLSSGFPQMRVDFYIIENTIYVSELTLTATGGHITYLTQTCLNELGNQIRLPKK